MPREFTRTDSAPIKYHKQDGTGIYKPTLDRKGSKTGLWNLAKLSSRENPLVIFTLTTQAVIGAFLLTFFGSFAGIESMQIFTASNMLVPFLFILIGLQSFVLFLSTRHLGKPWRFYRGFNNLRHSPLSREALGISMFFGFMVMVTLLSLTNHGFLNWTKAGTILRFINNFIPWLDAAVVNTITSSFIYLAALSGLFGLYFMQKIYRVKARPFWDHWQVMTSFFGSMFTLGALLIGLVCFPITLIYEGNAILLLNGLTVFITFGLTLEIIGHLFHIRYLKQDGSEAAGSYYMLITQFGKTYITRNVLLGFCLVAMFSLSISQIPEGWQGILIWSVLAAAILTTALVSRALFYVLVIPTTMPGAFFWRNKGFEEHARKTGLAKLPQVGVLQCGH